MNLDTHPQQMGVVLELCGDHQCHSIQLSSQDVSVSFDRASIVLTIHASYDAEHVASHLYWELLRIVPLLRDDRY